MNIIKSLFIIIKSIFIFLFYIIKVVFSIIFAIFSSFFAILRFIKNIFASVFGWFLNLLRFSITFKITFVYGMIIALLLFLTSSAILFGFRFYLYEEAKKDVVNHSSILTDYIDEQNTISQAKISKLAQDNNLIVTLFDDNKKLIYSTNENMASNSLPNLFYSPTIIGLGNKEVVTFVKIINLNNDSILYLQITKNLDNENTYITILITILLIVNGLGLIFILLIGSSISKKMLRPVRDMTNTVKAIDIDNLDTRLDVSGSHDELKDLAETFNSMFDRIKESYDKQNQFVSDASHELRTPISVIQGYANLLDRWGKENPEVMEESIEAIKSESENMKHLIEKLLFLARRDKNLIKLEKETFSVNDLILEIVKETKLIDFSHEIISDIEDDVFFYGDYKSIKQAIRILVDNSVKFTPVDGTIKVSSSCSNKFIFISVEDTGVGIPEEDIPRIFDRFYRSDKSRTKESGGHGLGLSIAKWIVDAHNGKINVKSKVGIGTKITISLPIS